MIRTLCATLLLATCAGCLGTACRTGARGDGARPRASPPAPPPAAATVIADSDEMLYPDPVERTTFRIDVVRRMLSNLGEAEGALPPSLDALLPEDRAAGWELRLKQDAWSRPLRYRPAGRAFELRSAGPDGTFGTRDDIVATREAAAGRR